VIAGSLLGGTATAGPATPVALKGVLDEPVALGPPQQARTTILFFMSRRAREACSTFGGAVDERLLDVAVESVGIIDVRPYAGWMRPIATSRLRREAEAARERRRQRRIARGVDASAEVVNRWHLIGDFDGSLFARFGVQAEPERPLAFVLDREGRLRGPYDDVSTLVAVVAEATSHSHGG
jgi:hypothetical protein